MMKGYSCSKNVLMVLNLIYIIIGLILIGVGIYARAASIVAKMPLIGGIITCGVVLILVSLLGLVGAARHHKTLLSYYCIFLFVLFVIQFLLAISCLRVDIEHQNEIADVGWQSLTWKARDQVQDRLRCCGFILSRNAQCEKVNRRCCSPADLEEGCVCSPCLILLQKRINEAFRLAGGFALVFSLTEVLAVFIARRYRNLTYARDFCGRRNEAQFRLLS